MSEKQETFWYGIILGAFLAVVFIFLISSTYKYGRESMRVEIAKKNAHFLESRPAERKEGE